MRRPGHTFILLLSLAVLYAGPVAACICFDDHAMAQMPCCPDQPQDLPDFALADAFVPRCDPAPASLLPASGQDIPAPIALSAAPPPWQTHGPPSSLPLPASSAIPLGSPPLYLITLRLRI